MQVLITDSLRIRVTLAFIVLRHKPKELSLDAYVLDLRERFPLLETPEAQQSDTREPWRDRALKLEEKVKELTRELEQKCNEFEIARCYTQSTSGTCSGTSQNGPPKKKRKSVVGAPARVVTSSICEEMLQGVSRVGEDLRCTEVMGSLHLFGSYHKLASISSKQSPTDLYKVIESANSVLRSVSKALLLIIEPTDDATTKDPPGIVKDLTSILYSILKFLVSHIPTSSKKMRRLVQERELECLSVFFSIITFDIAIPIVKSFHRITKDNHMSLLLQATQNSKSQPSKDVASICFALLQLLKSVLQFAGGQKNHSLSHKWAELVETIKMAAVAEISNLWNASGADYAETDNSGSIENTEETRALSREERILRLVRKDTLWYLCSIVYETLSLDLTHRTDPQDSSVNGFVQNKLEQSLSSLLTRYSTTSDNESESGARKLNDMGTVEKGMIAAVVEQLWLRSRELSIDSSGRKSEGGTAIS